MRALIKRPVRIGDKLFECGEHEIDAALANHWYLKALVSDGLAQIIDDKPEPQPEATKVAPEVKSAAPAPAKPAQHPKPVKRAGKK